MQIVLTRPVAQQAAWAEAVQAQGWTAVSLPMLTIESMPFAWPADISVYQALMFVSSNAVQGFFRVETAIFKKNQYLAPEDIALNAINLIANHVPQRRYWATGPGTVQALLAAGVLPESIDAPAHAAGQFDSEHLWQMVASQIAPGSRVLIVRGQDIDQPDSSRDWLARQIAAAGSQADCLSVYARRAPQWNAAQLAQMQAGLHDGSVWLWSSSQALRNLPASLDTSRARCVCTHERIAQAARARGFAVVCTSRPLLADVVASIKSLDE
jgi:uroporphyrinogen-III synthase